MIELPETRDELEYVTNRMRRESMSIVTTEQCTTWIMHYRTDMAMALESADR